MGQKTVVSTRIWLTMLLSWSLTLFTISAATYRIKAHARQVRRESTKKEQALLEQMGTLQDQLIEISERNKSNRRLLALAGYLPTE